MFFVFSLVPPVWLMSSKSGNQSRTSQRFTADYWPMCQCFNKNSVRCCKELDQLWCWEYWSPSTVLPHESQWKDKLNCSLSGNFACTCPASMCTAVCQGVCGKVKIALADYWGYYFLFFCDTPLRLGLVWSLCASRISFWYSGFRPVQKHAMQDDWHVLQCSCGFVIVWHLIQGVHCIVSFRFLSTLHRKSSAENGWIDLGA